MTTIAFVFNTCGAAAIVAAFLVAKAWRYLSVDMGWYATSPVPTPWTAFVWYRYRTGWRLQRTILHLTDTIMVSEEGK